MTAEYDARRGSARERGYDRSWDKEAALYREKHPFCLGCDAVGRVAAASLVDHVIPHKGDQRLMWDKTNWQPACRPHHDVVKQRLEDLYARDLASAADLRLDSARAITLTKELLA